MSKITFVDKEAAVQGPNYNNDAVEKASVYQRYQYIKLKFNFNMKRVFKILAVVALLSGFCYPDGNSAYGQTPKQIKKYVKKGRKAYQKGEYWKSKSYYDKVTSSSTTKPQYWLEAGKGIL